MWYRLSQSQYVEKQPSLFSNEEIPDTEEEWEDEHDRVRENAMNDFLSNPKAPQKWEVVPFARLQKIWNDYAKNGIIRDERGLQEIADLMIKNTMLLYFNTVMCGHTPLSSQGFVEMYAPDGTDWTDELDELYGEHIEDKNGSYRISDFAMEPLLSDAAQLRSARIPEDKLFIIDRMLNRVHPRSDIASLFVEGGSKSLQSLSEGFYPEETYREMQYVV